MSGYSNSEESLKSLTHWVSDRDLCAICNTSEGVDPKAHQCQCDECFQEWDGDEPMCDCKGEEE